MTDPLPSSKGAAYARAKFVHGNGRSRNEFGFRFVKDIEEPYRLTVEQGRELEKVRWQGPGGRLLCMFSVKWYGAPPPPPPRPEDKRLDEFEKRFAHLRDLPAYRITEWMKDQGYKYPEQDSKRACFDMLKEQFMEFGGPPPKEEAAVKIDSVIAPEPLIQPSDSESEPENETGPVLEPLPDQEPSAENGSDAGSESEEEDKPGLVQKIKRAVRGRKRKTKA